MGELFLTKKENEKKKKIKKILSCELRQEPGSKTGLELTAK